jgi:hypothetical protein
LVEAFGWEVVHGKAVFGAALSEEVKKLIRTSGCRRVHHAPRPSCGRSVADAQEDPRIPWVEVREEGVMSAGRSGRMSDQDCAGIAALPGNVQSHNGPVGARTGI